jgi:thioredoxin reductase (NADPH)
MTPKMWDVVIVGAGPAGYTAGVYTSRARLSTLIVTGDQPGGQLTLTTEVENFPGFPAGIRGPELMVSMEAQAKKFGAEVRYSLVSKVELKSEIKKIWIGEEVIEAKSVVLSTGAKPRMLGIGEEKYWSKGLSTCAVCDAAFYKDKVGVVVGGGDAAIEDALALSKFANQVYLIHRRGDLRASKIMQERLLADPKIKIVWNTEVIGVSGEEKLSRLRLKDVGTGEESDLTTDGLFLAIGHLPATDLFQGLVETDDHGYLMTTQTALMKSDLWRVSDKDYLLEGLPTQTSEPGVFGAGDVVDYRYRQAITAAGMGCQAALDVEKYLTGGNSSY